MLKIYLSINNGEQVMLLPITPEEYEIKESWNNQEVEMLYQNLNLIGNRQMSNVELSSFFPIREYPFSLNNTMFGMDYVNMIMTWQDRKLPLRLTIVNTDTSLKIETVSLPVTIDTFTHKTGKDGDIYYTLSLREFVFVKL